MMTFQDQILATSLFVAVTLDLLRLRRIASRLGPLFRSALLVGISITAVAAYLSAIKADRISELIWVTPLLLLTATAHALDPLHRYAPGKARIFIICLPTLMVAMSLAMGSELIRDSFTASPLKLTTAALLTISGGSFVAWRDFRNIVGMTPVNDSWKQINTTDEQIESPPRVFLSDDEIWGRIILICILIVLLIIQGASLNAETTAVAITPFPLILTILALVLAMLAGRKREQDMRRLHVPPRVYLLSVLVSLLSAAAVTWSAFLMSSSSNMRLEAVTHRCVVGILVGSMWTEDFLISLYFINRIPLRITEWGYATINGASWATMVAAASTVQYYSHGKFNIIWIANNGLLLFLAFLSSVLAWRTIGSFIPSSRLLTLKQPRDIALSDNTMFAGLAGGCVAGVSLVTNGQSPLIAGSLVGLVLTFIFFAIKNDKEHLSNEIARLRGPGIPAGRTADECQASLTVLRRHLRFQELIPLIAVFASFSLAALVWIIP